MAYENYLLKIGNYTFPLKYIKAETYSAYINMQDLDPWTDGDGYLHRTAVELKALKIEFNTISMTDTEFTKLMANIRANFTNEQARECTITAYIPELGTYITQKGYRADIKPVVYGIKNGEIRYEEVDFAFVGGVA